MKTILVALALSIAATAHAQDSTKTATLQILPRAHYGGYFPFTGALLNHNPVVDVNVFYEKKSLGFFLFQSFDLKERSYVNYFQPGIFATARFNPKLKLRGFFGYLFSQTHKFMDKGDSDFYTAGSLYWDPAKKLSIQNTLLYYDITVSGKLANRVQIAWSERRFKTELFIWNRFELEGEKRQAISGSVALTFPIIKVSEKTSVQFTTSYMWYFTDYRPSFALDRGFLFTLSVPINL